MKFYMRKDTSPRKEVRIRCRDQQLAKGAQEELRNIREIRSSEKKNVRRQ